MFIVDPHGYRTEALECHGWYHGVPNRVAREQGSKIDDKPAVGVAAPA
jgi:hypothetical protein